MKIRLTDDWRQAHKWISTRSAALGFALSAAGTGLAAAGSSAMLFKYLPVWLALLILTVIFAATFVGRLVILERKNGK